MIKSLFYLSEREEGNMFFMLPTVLFYSLGYEFCNNLLKSLETYSDEAIEYIQALQGAIHHGCYIDSKEYLIVHDAFLLNADGRIATIKEMRTDAGKALIRQRRAALRMFSYKSKSNQMLDSR